MRCFREEGYALNVCGSNRDFSSSWAEVECPNCAEVFALYEAEAQAEWEAVHEGM